MPKGPQNTRAQQPYTAGLGKIFTSPVKRRNKVKSTTVVAPIGLEIRQRRLLKEIQRLKARSMENPSLPITLNDHDDPFSSEISGTSGVSESTEPLSPTPCMESSDFDHDFTESIGLESLDTTPKTRRTLPNTLAQDLNNRWTARLPSLVDPLSLYITRTTGVLLEPMKELKTICSKDTGVCLRKTTMILCLFFDREFIPMLQF
jgi:hypothetical protein